MPDSRVSAGFLGTNARPQAGTGLFSRNNHPLADRSIQKLEAPETGRRSREIRRREGRSTRCVAALAAWGSLSAHRNAFGRQIAGHFHQSEALSAAPAP